MISVQSHSWLGCGREQDDEGTVVEQEINGALVELNEIDHKVDE